MADGAFLYTDARMDEDMLRDESFERMHFLLGRFERTASEFYSEYAANNDLFYYEPIKRMSRLTENLLHGIDYSFCEQRRKDNFSTLHEELKDINQLRLKQTAGTFMYPLLIDNGVEIRKNLQKIKIYIPTLWPDVFTFTEKNDPEYNMAENLLPLPIDQRYSTGDMDIIVKEILKCIVT